VARRDARLRGRLTLAVLVLASVTILTLDYRGTTAGLVSAAKGVAHGIVDPVRAVVGDVVDPVGSFFAGAFDARAIEDENARLRAENARLREELLASAGAEERLRSLLALEGLFDPSHVPAVVAEVTLVDTSNFAASVEIDKGTAAGVAVGMPVLGAGGLIGRVVQAWKRGADVELVTDVRSEVGVRFGAAGNLALVVGRGAGRPLAVDDVAPGTPIRRGEVLETSGLEGALFPPGIPVAIVTSVAGASGQSALQVEARPAAHLGNLEYVEVLEWEPSS
jgi:rod shape-determining protein MreC